MNYNSFFSFIPESHRNYPYHLFYFEGRQLLICIIQASCLYIHKNKSKPKYLKHLSQIEFLNQLLDVNKNTTNNYTGCVKLKYIHCECV